MNNSMCLSRCLLKVESSTTANERKLRDFRQYNSNKSQANIHQDVYTGVDYDLSNR